MYYVQVLTSFRQSFVHKFIVRNTIEEKIHSAISENADTWDENKVTIGQLRDLFMEQYSEIEANCSTSSAQDLVTV